MNLYWYRWLDKKTNLWGRIMNDWFSQMLHSHGGGKKQVSFNKVYTQWLPSEETVWKGSKREALISDIPDKHSPACSQDQHPSPKSHWWCVHLTWSDKKSMFDHCSLPLKASCRPTLWRKPSDESQQGHKLWPASLRLITTVWPPEIRKAWENVTAQRTL